METVIYLIRHGESQGNKEGRFRGRTDFPLTENGMRQARELCGELKEIELAAVYSSPLRRALDTAKVVAEPHGLEPVVEEGFNNISLGEWEGKPKDEIREKYPDLWRLWITTPEKLEIPGGESLRKVMERSVKALERIVERHSGQTVAIVTHRAVLKPLLAGILGIAEPYFWKLHMDTASYSILEHREGRGYTLSLLNQTRHLREFIKEVF